MEGQWSSLTLAGKLRFPVDAGQDAGSVQAQRTALEDFALSQQGQALAARLREELSAAGLPQHHRQQVLEAATLVLEHLASGRSFFIHPDAEYRAELLRRQLGEWGQRLRNIPFLGTGLLALWCQVEQLALTNERREVCRAQQVEAAKEPLPDWMVEEEATDYEEGETPGHHRPMW